MSAGQSVRAADAETSAAAESEEETNAQSSSPDLSEMSDEDIEKAVQWTPGEQVVVAILAMACGMLVSRLMSRRKK